MSYIINQNVEKFAILVNILYLLFFFLRNIRERYLSLKDADNEQSKKPNKNLDNQNQNYNSN